MGEIKDFVSLYIQDSDILEESANQLAMNLEINIKNQLWEGHGYDEGRLKRSIRVVSHVYKNYAILTGYFDAGLAPHGFYVLSGVRGKGIAKSGPIDFLGDGLKKTMEIYQ